MKIAADNPSENDCQSRSRSDFSSSRLSATAVTLDTHQRQSWSMTYPIDAVFESTESGRHLTKRQIGFGAWKEGMAVERVEGEFLVDGERYERVSE